MPQQPTLFPKPHPSTRSPGDYSATGTIALFPSSVSPQHAAEIGAHQQVFRTKRKHVLKACDRCRVKKTKVELYFSSLRCIVVGLTGVLSAMETSRVIAAQHITIHAYFGRERPCKRRLIREGEDPNFRLLLIVVHGKLCQALEINI